MKIGTPYQKPPRGLCCLAVVNKGIAFSNLEHALAVPGSQLRLFGKPEAFQRRRMGVALARGETVEQARERAGKTAAMVKPLAS